MGLRARQAHLAESIRLIFISLSPFAARLEVVWDCTVAPRRRRRLSLRCAVVHAMAASGMEDERVSEEVRREEEDDDVPQLSAAAMEALREFLAEQQRPEEQDEGEGGGRVELVAEDWRLSQFWYDERTARALVEEVVRLVSPSGSGSAAGAVACIACPTLYAYLKKTDPGVPAQLLEYDERFGQYGGDFTFYDYNRPEDLPPAMKHAYRVVVADPPYLVWFLPGDSLLVFNYLLAFDVSVKFEEK